MSTAARPTAATACPPSIRPVVGHVRAVDAHVDGVQTLGAFFYVEGDGLPGAKRSVAAIWMDE